jgi:hypothetical protein
MPTESAADLKTDSHFTSDEQEPKPSRRYRRHVLGVSVDRPELAIEVRPSAAPGGGRATAHKKFFRSQTRDELAQSKAYERFVQQQQAMIVHGVGCSECGVSAGRECHQKSQPCKPHRARWLAFRKLNPDYRGAGTERHSLGGVRMKHTPRGLRRDLR